jgi:hypothetical protein
LKICSQQVIRKTPNNILRKPKPVNKICPLLAIPCDFFFMVWFIFNELLEFTLKLSNIIITTKLIHSKMNNQLNYQSTNTQIGWAKHVFFSYHSIIYLLFFLMKRCKTSLKFKRRPLQEDDRERLNGNLFFIECISLVRF